MMALRLDMYSSTVIRSDDQPLDSPSTSGETHRKSVLLRKKAAKVLSKNFEVLGCWEGRRNPGEGEGEEKNEGVKIGDFGVKRAKIREFPRKTASGNRKHRTSAMESSEVYGTNIRGLGQRSPRFWGFRWGIYGVSTPSLPQFCRICHKKMYISAIQV